MAVGEVFWTVVGARVEVDLLEPNEQPTSRETAKMNIIVADNIFRIDIYRTRRFHSSLSCSWAGLSPDGRARKSLSRRLYLLASSSMG